jgi:hypothetical protein
VTALTRFTRRARAISTDDGQIWRAMPFSMD